MSCSFGTVKDVSVWFLSQIESKEKKSWSSVVSPFHGYKRCVHSSRGESRSPVLRFYV